jgi:hypothetical protein
VLLVPTNPQTSPHNISGPTQVNPTSPHSPAYPPASQLPSFPRPSTSYVAHPPCSLGLSATSQQYFSLRTNQPPATSQQNFSQNKPAPAISHQRTGQSVPALLDLLPSRVTHLSSTPQLCRRLPEAEPLFIPRRRRGESAA